MYLLPKPQHMEIQSGFLQQTTVFVKNSCQDPRIEKALNKLPQSPLGICLEITAQDQASEGYVLTVTEDKITLEGDSAAGVFYGIQTLRQLFANGQVPCLTIKDLPGFSYRGFYHDITRGKVPKLETLKALIDQMAYYKMNSLQLYVEHAFPFKELGSHVEKTGYITPEELKALDDYCYENFIEFIPSIATFGHLYVLLQQEAYKDLQELENYEEDQIYWYQRMLHHTIDPTKDRSFEVVKSLIDQYLPLFRTNKFNICCDETFDLRVGRHKDQDTGKLYIEFVKKIVDYLSSQGKTIMMWADEILLQHPENIAELPRSTEFLNWTYAAEPKEDSFEILGSMPCTQIVCPGTHTWSRLVEGIDIGSKNILALGRYGHKYHAKGMLNTNWGDYGNPCSLEMSMHGMVLGACISWNADTDKDDYFTDSLNYLLYKNSTTAAYVSLLDTVQSKLNWLMLARCYSNCIYEKKFDVIFPTLEDVIHAQTTCLGVIQTLSQETWALDEYRRELLIAAEGLIVMAELFAKCAGYSITRYSDTNQWYEKFRTKWLEKNKPSELYEIEKMFVTLENTDM